MAPRHPLGSNAPREGAANRRRSSSRPPANESARAPKKRRSSLLGAAIGVLLGAGGLAAATWTSGCEQGTTPPGPTAEAADSGDPFAGLPEPPAMPDDSNAPIVEEPDPPEEKVAADEEPEEQKPWEGPWLGALAHSTPIYPTARFSRNRMGYIRKGGKVPLKDEKPIKTNSCRQGFYALVDGGYVCGKYSTPDLEDARFKLGIKPPNLDAPLPYRYAYNKAHGTPLYVSVPSKDEMLEYEPYLRDKEAAKKAKAQAKDADQHADEADKPRGEDEVGDGETKPAKSKPAEGGSDAGGEAAPAPSGSAEPTGEGGDGAGGAEEKPPAKPWWQNEKVDEVKLEDLDESDGTLRKRMVKGFFIAIDKTFGWNNRHWYKTTDGLIAPADRMIIPKTPELKGRELGDDEKQVGFALWRRAYRYTFDDDKLKRGDKLKLYDSFVLTGETKLHDKHRYRKTADGWWFKEQHGTYTDPGPRPSEVGEDEKWVDVNLSRKTLTLMVGDKPVYAALISPGKRSKNRAKDHRTKTGKWRIREKHITTTMDGDGPAGDLPYSIQDVPFVQYYDGSYALHGAFWHNSFGHEKSHGCVNLSPADAKHVFMWTEPSLPRGWHGAWSSNKRRGSWVVVHE